MRAVLRDKVLNSDVVVTFILFVAIFSGILLLRIPTDIQSHINFIVQGRVPANFLYYLTVRVVGLLIPFSWNLRASAVIVLASALTLRYIITKDFIRSSLPSQEGEFLPVLIAFCLSFSFCIPVNFLLGISNYFYLGNLTPNVWHNSTTIAVFPFALMLFIYSYQRIGEWKSRYTIAICGLVVINALIKPSYLFVFLPTFPILLILSKQSAYKKLISSLPVLLALGLIVLQILFFYGNDTDHSIKVKPFLVWSQYSSNIPLSFASSSVILLAWSILFTKEFFRDRLSLYVAGQYVLGVIIAILFVEDGHRWSHGNFFWQNFITGYILRMVIYSQLLRLLYKQINEQNSDGLIQIINLSVFVRQYWRYILMFCLMSYETFFGIIYLVRIFLLSDYT